MTEVNTHDEQDEVPAAPSVAVMLVNTADVILRGMPEPVSVDVSTRWGLIVDLASHSQLWTWARRLALLGETPSCQPFIRDDGVLCQLTNLYGTWRDRPVRLHCLEPVDALPAMRGEVDP